MFVEQDMANDTLSALLEAVKCPSAKAELNFAFLERMGGGGGGAGGLSATFKSEVHKSNLA